MTTTPEPVRMTGEQAAVFRAEMERYQAVNTSDITSPSTPMLPRPLPHCPRCGQQERNRITAGGDPLPPDTITFETCGHAFLPPLSRGPLEA